MLQPIVTSGIKIKTTLDTSNACDHGRDQPYSRQDGGHTEDLSPVRRTYLGYP
jgi:hypothetical protein